MLYEAKGDFDTPPFALYMLFLLFLIQRFQGEIEGGAFPFFGIEPQLAAELFDKVFAQH